jgi:ABC-type amino acid transport system permease subunit
MRTLAVGYSAFLAELYPAGIQSIERGQMEAARSLGVSYWQAMPHVILPQAIRPLRPLTLLLTPPGWAPGLPIAVSHCPGCQTG